MISIVIPVFNEVESLRKLNEELFVALSHLSLPFEIIFIDDGSTDGSLPLLKEFHQKDARVKLLSFSRNFGHQVALTAGLDHASGEAVITMDADLQHPPRLIPDMVFKWKEGFDVVATIREYGADEGWFKRWSSHVYYWLMNKLSRTGLKPHSADFRLLSRPVVDSLRQFQERSRLLRGMIGWVGFKQTYLTFTSPPRFGGRPKYSLGKMISLALDGLLSFSTVPLYLSIYLGMASAFFSFFYSALALYWKFFTDRTVQGWTTIVILVLFLGGVQLIALGIMGGYIGKMYEELKRRPLYIVKEAVGLASPSVNERL